jgi:hypothetical protein
VDLAVGPGGRTALVTSDEGAFGYAVAGPDGIVTALTPAPEQPFSPLVAWLDTTRLLALSTDAEQVSGLAVVDTAAHRMDVARGLSGVRVFAASSNGKIVAAATENAIYAGPLASFTSATAPTSIVALAEGQVVWALALDTSGARLFMLSGTIAADGSIGDVRELGYAGQGSNWQKVLDSAVPFGRAIGQVHLPA